jgi:hypothetical protein
MLQEKFFKKCSEDEQQLILREIQGVPDKDLQNQVISDGISIANKSKKKK